MNYILFDDQNWHSLLPLTFPRPVCELRIGILTIREKWEKMLKSECSFITQSYLSEKFRTTISSDNYLINGTVTPSQSILNKIAELKINQAIVSQNTLIAVRLHNDSVAEISLNDLSNIEFAQKNWELISCDVDYFQLKNLWDIFKYNGEQLSYDFKLLTAERESMPLSKRNNVIGEENIFLEEGATVEFATLNAKNSFMYIGKDAEIMEGTVVRGSLALCEHATLKIAAKIYGPTTIGPHSKVGGEVNNSVIQGFSNKGHDGFLGNSVIGEWCNLGADTNNSNLKNNYAEVKLWNYTKQSFVPTGLQFCGLIMGDHSKCGINTMFNTGTVVGVSANIFGTGFPRNFIPSFSWGGAAGFKVFELNKAFEVAERVMERRNIKFDEIEKNILKYIFENTKF